MILSMDPGLATFGLAFLGARGEILRADALKTETDAAIAKRTKSPAPTRKSAKTSMELAERARRIREIWRWITDAVDVMGPPAIAVAEAGRAMGKAGSSAVISLAAGSTLATLIADEIGCPLIWATPAEWRRYFVGAPAADFGKRQRAPGVPTDDELYAAIGSAARRVVDQELAARGRPADMWPHALDATGQGRWALASSLEVQEAMKARASS